jgi:phosphopantetheinyl transferase (holo-ACP synthase)
VTGNDIVDLRSANIPCGIKGERFLQKIFTGEEQEIINSGRVGVWVLWAMKEAVYKAHHRRFNLPRSFNPKGIQVNIWKIHQTD